MGKKGDYKKEGYSLHAEFKVKGKMIFYGETTFDWSSQQDVPLLIMAKNSSGAEVGCSLIAWNRDLNGYTSSTFIYEPHQRKGLATAMYCLAEEMLGTALIPDLEDQTEAAKGLWNQIVRPFGNLKEIIRLQNRD